MEENVLTIENGVVKKCDKSAVSVVIPDGVTAIGWQAFNCCRSLVSVKIPKGVTKIGDAAFSYCPSLESVAIPDSVQRIESSAFCNCESLKSVVIPDGVTAIGWHTFEKCSQLESVAIGKSVASIGEASFKECKSLKSAEIPDGVKEIESHAFEECIALESVKLPASLTTIGEEAFKDCSLLKSIEIPATVTKIEWHAFTKCSSLKSLIIPDGVTRIGHGIFEYCKSLKSLVIGKGVSEIERWAFDGCSSLSEIEFRGTIEEWDNIDGLFNLFEHAPATSVKCSDGEWKKPAVIVSDGELLSCVDKTATSITIGEGVTKISRYAFKDCNALESVVMSEGVESIDPYAFDGCSSLKYIEIPSTVKYIYRGAFDGCDSVEKIVSKSEKFPFNEKTRKLYDARGNRKIPILELQAAKEEAKKEKIGQVQKASATAILESIISEHNAQTTTAHLEDKSYLRIKASDGGVEILLADSKVTKWSKTLPALLDFTATGADAASIRKVAAENALEDASRKFLSVSNDGVVKMKRWVRPVHLALPDGVSDIRIKPYYLQESLESVVIPSSVTKIGKGTFEGCVSLSEIKFTGTVEQWNAIEKGKEWSKDVGAKCVKCSDGDAAL